MAAGGRRKAVGLNPAGLKPAEPAQRGLHSSAETGGMAKPLDTARTGALGAAGGVAAAAVGHSAANAECQPAHRSVRAEAFEHVKLLAAGGVAGAVSKSATAPLARLTILYQVRCCAAKCNLHSLAHVTCRTAGLWH